MTVQHVDQTERQSHGPLRAVRLHRPEPQLPAGALQRLGDEIWGKELDHLNDGEVDVQCPECEEELLIDLQYDDSDIQPGLHSELAGRLHAEAIAARRESVATVLTHLFGRIICPECGTRFVLADHVAGVSPQ